MGIDPVLVASQIVVSLQSIVSRSIAPLEPGVITVGAIHGGFKHNIIGFCPGVETIRLPVGESPPRSSQGFPAALSTMQKPSKKLKNNLWLGITAHSSD